MVMDYFIFVVGFYVANICVLATVVLAYYGMISGIWPPPTRKAFLAGWGWYAASLAVALRLSLLPPSIPKPFDSLVWRGAGTILIGLSCVVFLWAIAAFRSIGRVAGTRIDRLITGGPYRYVRHPQYTSLFLFLYGFTLVQSSLHFLAYSLIISAIFHFLAMLEERYLMRRFGEDYSRYRENTPMFIPRLRKAALLQPEGKTS